MDAQPGPVHRRDGKEPSATSAIVLVLEAIAVMLLIFALALGLLIRSGV
jgi:hypothetical protein